MNKIRTQRVESLLKREIATMIMQDVKDPRVNFVSVTEVSLTNDMKTAHVYVSIMGDEETKQKGLKGLKNASGFLRHQIGESIRLRVSPKIVFTLDRSIDEHARIDRLLKEIEDKKAGEDKNE